MWTFKLSKPRLPRNPGVFLGFCCACALILALLAAPGLRAAEGEYQVQQLKPNVFVWIPDDVVDLDGDPQYSRASAVGFVITDQGVVVIGATNNPLHAREALYEIRRRTEAPVIDVIDLDPDGDQVLGNEVFAEQRAQIISTSSAAAQMQTYEAQLSTRRAHESDLRARLRGIHFTLPTRTFDRALALRPGSEEIRVLRVNTGAAGETGGDAVVFLPAQKVLFLGDLYDNGYVPAMGSRDIRRWIDTLGQLETWKADTFVPAHGLPGSRQDVEQFRQFLQWIVSEVQTLIQEGQSLKQVKEALLTSSQFRLRAWENVPQTLTAVYQQLVHAPASVPGGASAKESGSSVGALPPKPAGANAHRSSSPGSGLLR
ncbi:MAG: MBL fold metallo-hydrolase [Terriglobia bacterium]